MVKMFAGLTAAVPALGDFAVFQNWNAVPSGDSTVQVTLEACQALCGSGCTQFSWNLKSHQCFTSTALELAGLGDDHVVSGCDSSAVIGCDGSWTFLDEWNAVASGKKTVQASFAKCEVTCVSPCVQFSWNRKSGHCYTSAASSFGGLFNDHVMSGCKTESVDGCGSPTPAPTPPEPTPTPSAGGGPFDSEWFSSRTATDLSADADVLTWNNIKKPDTVVTYLPKPISLSKDGDVANIKMDWKSDGEDSCPSSDWAKHGFCKDNEPCLHTSIHCLAGTGDFRIGFLDSNGAAKITESGWADKAVMNQSSRRLLSKRATAQGEPLDSSMGLFSKYLGYSIRFFPHVSTKAEHYKPKKSGSTAVPCSFNWNGLKHTGPLSKERLGYHGCYEAPAGKWNDFDFKIKRVSKSEAKLSMSMAGVSYSYTHKMSSSEAQRFPQKIDAIMIDYPNSRHYAYVKMAPYGSQRSELVANFSHTEVV